MKRFGVVILVSVLVFSSCATAHQTTIGPVHLDEPVSATSSIITKDGRTLEWFQDFDVVDEFEFTVILPGKVARDTVDELDLTDRLAEVIADAGGDGIISLNIDADTYDTGTTIGTGAAKTVGTYAGMAGVMMFLAGAIWDVDVLLVTGGVFSGIGVAGWGTGLALQYTGHTELALIVSGDVIAYY